MDDAVSELKILLVFPSKLTRFMLQKFLGEAGFIHFTSVETLQQAVSAVENQPPDVVLSSMYFTDGDVNQLLKLAKHSEKTIHFLLISAEHRWRQLDPIKQSGIIAVLKKPFTDKQLLKAMRFVENLEQGVLNEPSFSELKILLVDDSALAREHMRQVLTQLSVQHIIECENGQQAYDCLLQESVHLVISDYHMPEMNGEQLLQRIRSTKSLHDLPVVLVSSERQQEVLARLQSLQVEACLDKPFDVEKLKSVLALHAPFSAVD